MSEPLLLDAIAAVLFIPPDKPRSVGILTAIGKDARVVERLTHFYRNSPGYDGGYPTEDEARAQAIRTRDALFGAPK